MGRAERGDFGRTRRAVGTRFGDRRIRGAAAGRPPLGRSTSGSSGERGELAVVMARGSAVLPVLTRLEWNWKNENGRDDYGVR